RNTGRAEPRCVRVDIPVQTLAGPLEDAIDRLTRSGGRCKEQRTCELVAGGCQQQIAVACQYANVVAVLMERVLPAAVADDPQQHQLAWMHVWIAVVRLVR